MSASRLVDLPLFRDPPADVLRGLRTVDPTAELVYMGDGAWYLGTVERSTVRERAGWVKRRRAARAWDRLARAQREDPARAAMARWMWWEGTLLLQGFAGIEVFQQTDPDSAIEEFLRRRDYTWRRDLSDTYRRWLAEDDQDAREGREHPDDVAARYSSLLDDRKLRDAHRHAWRRPIHSLPAAPRPTEAAA